MGHYISYAPANKSLPMPSLCHEFLRQTPVLSSLYVLQPQSPVPYNLFHQWFHLQFDLHSTIWNVIQKSASFDSPQKSYFYHLNATIINLQQCQNYHCFIEFELCYTCLPFKLVNIVPIMVTNLFVQFLNDVFHSLHHNQES